MDYSYPHRGVGIISRYGYNMVMLSLTQLSTNARLTSWTKTTQTGPYTLKAITMTSNAPRKPASDKYITICWQYSLLWSGVI